jgi:hypothetical protein
VGLTNNSIYCHFSSNNYNSQQLRQNTHKNFKTHLQDITLQSYIQYIALSTICFVLLPTETHSTDTGLEHILHRFTSSLAVPQLQFSITLSSTLALSISCCPLAFYAAYCTSRTFFAVPVLDILSSNFLPLPRREGSGIPAALRSGRHTNRRYCPILFFFFFIYLLPAIG